MFRVVLEFALICITTALRSIVEAIIEQLLLFAFGISLAIAAVGGLIWWLSQSSGAA